MINLDNTHDYEKVFEQHLKLENEYRKLRGSVLKTRK
jgi:hypothetical protein